jgi:hypothetical protein
MRCSMAERVRSDTLNCAAFAVAASPQALLLIAGAPIVSAPSYRRSRQLATHLRDDTLQKVVFAVAAPTPRALLPIANALVMPTRANVSHV